MAKKLKPDETSDAMPTDTTATKKPTKTQMVQEAMKAGKKKPQPIQAWILEKYGEEMKTQHISTIKSNLRKGSKKPRKTSETNGNTTLPKRNKADSLSLEEIRFVKALVDRLGRDQFRTVLDLLA